jgi:hypothetical protein
LGYVKINFIKRGPSCGGVSVSWPRNSPPFSKPDDILQRSQKPVIDPVSSQIKSIYVPTTKGEI